MRIAVDALGGDNAPRAVVVGAVDAARKLAQDEIILVGDRLLMDPYLGPDSPPNISIREAKGAIRMDEEPAAALRARPESSIAIMARMVREGDTDALFSAGNTGATVVAALLTIGRLRSCRRPAIATVLPFPTPVLLLDAGATISCQAQDLMNFAILGSVFAWRYFGTENPRVGLINVGEEPAKGNDLAKEAYSLMSGSGSIDFIGNVEGRDIGSGVADVLVTDGFTGNIVLKTAEGVAREILQMVRSAMTGGTISKLAAGVLRPRLMEVRDQVDPENYGGSFLLGVRGSVVIGHGNSEARGVENALLGISRAGAGLSETLEEALSQAHATAAGGSS